MAIIRMYTQFAIMVNKDDQRSSLIHFALQILERIAIIIFGPYTYRSHISMISK